MKLSIAAIIVLMAGGTSDYISKPVDVGQLLALLRVWLDRVVTR
jgi:DNA-binding response OmpR family regulator